MTQRTLEDRVREINQINSKEPKQPGSYELYTYIRREQQCYSLNLHNEDTSTKAIVLDLSQQDMKMFLFGMLVGLTC